MIKMILISFSLLMFFGCDEAEEALAISTEFGITGTYVVTDAMLYPNADCSGTPVSGVCNTADSVTVATDCPDSGWASYISEFDEWNMTFANDNQTVILDDGMETDTLTYTFDTTTLVIADSDSTSETITIAISSDNNNLEANLNAEASCSITYDNMGTYETEDACIDAGHEWDPALCIGLIFTLSETDNENDDENIDNNPPECVQDCPDYDLLSICDYDDEDCEEDEDANCVIVASWDGNDCFSDCEGDDADEVNMVLQTCIDCLANETDCEEALEEIYDEYGEYDNGPPVCVEDCPDYDLLSICDYDDEDCDEDEDANCVIIASWDGNDCFSDCEGDDADEVNMVLQTCTDCLANETDCEEALEDVYGDWDDEYEDPPACVEDCPDYDTLSIFWDGMLAPEKDVIDYHDCNIVITWVENECITDCAGYDMEEVELVIQMCTDCITNQTHCEEVFNDMYDDWDDGLDWPEAPECSEDCENFEALDSDNDYTNTEACGFVSQWSSCVDDCTGEDMTLVNEIITLCTECLANDTCDEEDISYSDNPLEGAWDTISSMFNMSITMDLSIVIANTDEQDCASIGTYSDSTCVVDEETMQTISLSTCNMMEGQLDEFLCSFNMNDSTYFTEGDSLNYQEIDIIENDLTITNVEDGVEDVSSGTIMAYGNILEWTINGEPTITGTYEIVEASADSTGIIDISETANLFFVFPDNATDILMMMDDEDFDENFAAAITEIYGSSEIVMSRRNRSIPTQPK